MPLIATAGEPARSVSGKGRQTCILKPSHCNPSFTKLSVTSYAVVPAKKKPRSEYPRGAVSDPLALNVSRSTIFIIIT